MTLSFNLIVRVDGAEGRSPSSIEEAVRATFARMPEFLVRIENPEDSRLSADDIVSVNVLAASAIYQHSP
jgi:hypothetical protein